MKDGFYEVGDEVYLTTYATKERMIVEQVYRYGAKPHYVWAIVSFTNPLLPRSVSH